MEQRLFHPEMHLSADETRERILQTAMHIFSEKGFARATTRIIASQAGVNEITLLRHFGSKYRLLIEAVDALYTTPHISEALHGSAPYGESIAHLAQVIVETLDRRRDSLRLNCCRNCRTAWCTSPRRW